MSRGAGAVSRLSTGFASRTPRSASRCHHGKLQGFASAVSLCLHRLCTCFAFERRGKETTLARTRGPSSTAFTADHRDHGGQDRQPLSRHRAAVSRLKRDKASSRQIGAAIQRSLPRPSSSHSTTRRIECGSENHRLHPSRLGASIKRNAQ